MEMEFDENTQPSSWAPNPEANTSVVPNRAYSQHSFSGILDRPLGQNVNLRDTVGSASRDVRVSMSTLSSHFMNDCSLNSNVDQSGGAEKNNGTAPNEGEENAQTNAQQSGDTQEAHNRPFRNQINNAIVLNNIISFSNH